MRYVIPNPANTPVDPLTAPTSPPALTPDEVAVRWRAAFRHGLEIHATIFAGCCAFSFLARISPAPDAVGTLFLAFFACQIAVIGMWLGMGRAPLWHKLPAVIGMIAIFSASTDRFGARSVAGWLATNAVLFALPAATARFFGLRPVLVLPESEEIRADLWPRQFSLAQLMALMTTVAVIAGLLKTGIIAVPYWEFSAYRHSIPMIGIALLAVGWAALSDVPSGTFAVITFTLPAATLAGLLTISGFTGVLHDGHWILEGAGVAVVLLQWTLGVVVWRRTRRDPQGDLPMNTFVLFFIFNVVGGTLATPGWFIALGVAVAQAIVWLLLFPFRSAGFRLRWLPKSAAKMLESTEHLDPISTGVNDGDA